MKKILTVFLLLAATQVLAASKPTLDFTPPPVRGGAIPIPDDTYDGTLASMACMSFSGPNGVVTDMSATLAIDHTWVGDLVVKVVAPDNTVLTLVSRPGFAETADDGTGCCGDSSDMSATAPVTFINGGATSGEDMGATITGTQIVCQDDGLCDYAPAPDTGPGTDFNDFIGMDAAGTWQICVGDSAGGDTGQIAPGTALNITAVIPPAAIIPSLNWMGLGLLALALFMLAGYQRRRYLR